MKPNGDASALWDSHANAWRDPADVVAGWQGAGDVDPSLLKERVRGDWWGLLEDLGVTLLVTREYEHLVVSMAAPGGSRLRRHIALAHPSGIAVDPETGTVHIAATRNPNQVYTFVPARGALDR